MTFDDFLTPEQNAVKYGIIDKIIDAGLKPHFFFSYLPDDRYADSVIAQSPWSTEAVEKAIKGSVGAVMIGFPRWKIIGEYEKALPSDYTHYEAGIAYTLGLPMFMVLEEGTEWRGAFDERAHNICTILLGADEKALEKPSFSQPFKKWLKDVDDRKDVFLGYCSKASGLASQIQLRLEKMGAKVMNWEMDFRSGVSILNEIENARSKCTCGIFLFSEDDPLEGDGKGAAPRDNVVFEAGYFMSSKGPDRCLIIREGQAKMPADIGGAIYLHVKKNESVNSIEGSLRSFLENNI